jgi:hypothetical protein
MKKQEIAAKKHKKRKIKVSFLRFLCLFAAISEFEPSF